LFLLVLTFIEALIGLLIIRMPYAVILALVCAVVDFLPSPVDVPPVKGRHPKTDEALERTTGDFEPLCALAFKVATDPFVGKLIFMRVYSGELKKGANVYNPRTQKRERVMRLIRLHANQREEVDSLYSGEIGAIAGIKGVSTGDTLCTEQKPIVLERITFPESGYAEDLAWAKACRDQGARLKLVLDSEVEHSHNYSLKSLHRKKYRHGETYHRMYGQQPNGLRQIYLCLREIARDGLYACRRFRFATIPYNLAYRIIIHRALHQGLTVAARRERAQ
jgi:hypothetical protein